MVDIPGRVPSRALILLQIPLLTPQNDESSEISDSETVVLNSSKKGKFSSSLISPDILSTSQSPPELHISVFTPKINTYSVNYDGPYIVYAQKIVHGKTNSLF